MKIAIIDYGMGNIYSLRAALKKVAPTLEVSYTHNIKELTQSDGLILPGVGNFGVAINKINNLGLRDYIREDVLINKKPILGVCLGMQLLFNEGTEGGNHKGLGLISGKVEKFSNKDFKIPHIGFNHVAVKGNSRIFQDVSNRDFYFIHSYRVKEVSEEVSSYGLCEYGEEFIASVEFENIVGTQFHPEKSQASGLKLLKNFLEPIITLPVKSQKYV